MAERPSSETPFERMDPAQVSGQSFAITRKGFDQMQVQAYLVSVSNQVKAGQQQIRDLREQVAQAEEHSEPDSEFSSQGVKLLDSGVEASRRQAQTEADEMAARARRLAEELQTTFEEVRSHQDFSGADELAELLEQAYEQAQAVAGLLQEARDQAEAEVEHGRAQGREIVEQAKVLRLTVLRDMGLGFLITDHNVRDTLAIVDRAYILHAGHVLMRGTPEEIIDHRDVRRVYLGEKFRL